MPRANDLAAARRQVGIHHLTIDPDNFTVGVAAQADSQPGDRIVVDLGGIGKGYALDKVAEILAEYDIQDALVHSASTVLAIGSEPEATNQLGWSLGIGGDWGKQAGREKIILTDKALSGSGTEVKGQHIKDPHTGQPAQGHLAAWATAPSAAVADGLSTAFMVMPTAAVTALCAKHEDIGAFVVLPENNGTPLLLLGDD